MIIKILPLSSGDPTYVINPDAVEYYETMSERDSYYGGPIMRIHLRSGKEITIPYNQGLNFAKAFEEWGNQ